MQMQRSLIPAKGLWQAAARTCALAAVCVLAVVPGRAAESLAEGAAHEPTRPLRSHKVSAGRAQAPAEPVKPKAGDGKAAGGKGKAGDSAARDAKDRAKSPAGSAAGKAKPQARRKKKEEPDDDSDPIIYHRAAHGMHETERGRQMREEARAKAGAARPAHETGRGAVKAVEVSRTAAAAKRAVTAKAAVAAKAAPAARVAVKAAPAGPMASGISRPAEDAVLDEAAAAAPPASAVAEMRPDPSALDPRAAAPVERVLPAVLPDDAALAAWAHPTHEELAAAAVQPKLAYTARGRVIMPAPLKGSHDVLVHQNTMADAEHLDRIQDDVQLEELIARRQLVEFPEAEGLVVNPALPGERKVARVWTVRFAEEMAHNFYVRFHQPMVVSSAVRTVEFQRRLQRVNGNAAATDGEAASPHLTGGAIDIAKRGMSAAEIAWMRSYLLPLMQAGKVDVEEEFKQACFHISVYRSYLPKRAMATQVAAAK